MRHIYIFISAFALIISACTGPLSGTSKAAIEFAEGQKLTVTVAPEGEIIDIRFTSVTAWNAVVTGDTSDTQWIQLIPSSGKGGDSVCKLQFKKNSSGQTRTATLEIISEDISRKVLFSQKSTTSDNREDDSEDDGQGDSGDDPENNPGSDAGNDSGDNPGNEGGNDSGDDSGDGGNDNPGGEAEPGQSGKYGWYELPAFTYTQSGSYMIDSHDSDLYYAHHLCAGNEKGPGGRKARNYTVCYSAEHHCPVWVAAPRHKMYESGASRTDAYGKDPDIPANIQYSSKSTGGGCNKGHMLGSAERLSSSATNKQVFYYTNIAPQYSDTFNTRGGGWNILEDWVDGQVCSDTLYVVIGAYFEPYTDRRGNSDSPKTISFGGRDDVTRPSMFYYILMRTKNGNTGKSLSECSASEIKCAAFVRSHDTPKKTAVGEKDMMSVSDLEKVTGFTYFPNVPHAPKSTCKASDWGL